MVFRNGNSTKQCLLCHCFHLLSFSYAPAPGAPPVNLSYANLTSSSLSLSWEPPTAEEHNGIIRRYIIGVTEEETGNQFNFSSPATATMIQQLHPNYRYSFRVSAVTVSPGPSSHPLTVQMLEDGKLGSRDAYLVS